MFVGDATAALFKTLSIPCQYPCQYPCPISQPLPLGILKPLHTNELTEPIPISQSIEFKCLNGMEKWNGFREFICMESPMEVVAKWDKDIDRGLWQGVFGWLSHPQKILDSKYPRFEEHLNSSWIRGLTAIRVLANPSSPSLSSSSNWWINFRILYWNMPSEFPPYFWCCRCFGSRWFSGHDGVFTTASVAGSGPPSN